MNLIVIILTAFVVATAAQNATFYEVEEAIEDHYIVVMKVREKSLFNLLMIKKPQLVLMKRFMKTCNMHFGEWFSKGSMLKIPSKSVCFFFLDCPFLLVTSQRKLIKG